MKHYVYLAGPITGLSYKGCQDWRDQVAAALDSDTIDCLTPMRGSAFLEKEGTIHAGNYNDVTANPKAIIRRDMFDTLRATCVFVNLLGATKVSVGTVMELAWAYQAQIPTVVIMEENNIHRHCMVDEACTFVVDTVEAGVRLTKTLLNETKK